ncbi:hypothetical protein HanIR_Chr04g0164361 [Helianthus annuus]|nr:hypothetical protein HanIR_Chr04g0164361 [Helianthus annuus]
MDVFVLINYTFNKIYNKIVRFFILFYFDNVCVFYILLSHMFQVVRDLKLDGYLLIYQIKYFVLMLSFESRKYLCHIYEITQIHIFIMIQFENLWSSSSVSDCKFNNLLSRYLTIYNNFPFYFLKEHEHIHVCVCSFNFNRT